MMGTLIARGGGSRLAAMLREVDWSIVDGVVLSHAGRPVDWSIMQTEMCGPAGVTVAGTPDAARALRWCRAVSEATTPPSTHAVQLAAAGEWLAGGQREAEARWYPRGIREARITDAMSASPSSIGIDLDLAMCAYHACAVQAPSWAVQALNRATPGQALSLGRELAAESRAHKNWRDRRWSTIRAAARRLWDSSLVDRVLPTI